MKHPMKILAHLMCLLAPVSVLSFTSMPSNIRHPSVLWMSYESQSSGQSSSPQQLTKFSPPPPEFIPKSLPVILGGGLFLFATSVRGQDKPFADALLKQAEVALRGDPTIGMELGQGVETGGVFASKFFKTSDCDFDQLVLQFQIEGGNAWAQGVAYGIRSKKDANNIQLVSLEVANMDASMNGTPFEVAIRIRMKARSRPQKVEECK
jgi:hypothetical protein